MDKEDQSKAERKKNVGVESTTKATRRGRWGRVGNFHPGSPREVYTAMEVECLSRPGHLEPVQVVRCREGKAGEPGGEVTDRGSWADIAKLNMKNDATQAGPSTDPASHRSPLRFIAAPAVWGQQDPQRQEGGARLVREGEPDEKEKSRNQAERAVEGGLRP